MYKKRNTNYQKKLLEQEKKIFSTADLSVLWGIEREETLWMTIQRYLKREILYSIQRGLYSSLPFERLNPYELGCAVAGPSSYVSAETILQLNGLMVQNLEKITLFGFKQKEFKVVDQEYLCRYLNHKFLLNRNGIIENSTYSLASVERAVVDLMYLNPHYYFDNQKAISQTKIKLLNRKVGYK